MYAGNETLISAAGEVFERDFIGECEVVVHREGHSCARHTFRVNGLAIARLRWRGMRRAVYEADGVRFDINVRALERHISVISEDGSESWLRERSRANPNRAGLRVEMAEGDNFRLMRSLDRRFRSRVSIKVHKQFYTSTLLVFEYDKRRRTQTTTRIKVNAVMKWEARFVHRLLALIVSRIILERRQSGARPLRTKEEPRRFAAGPCAGRRRRLH
ncbi:MAG TPA: hypothetical protein VLE20_03465 [Blastocatellia bacterium]|jgi:hypothetical protein|nr:hypothetical protein [Blastocatellia bacterium]